MHSASEYLGPEADAAVCVPGLRVDADEPGDGGNGKEPEHRRLWILVPFEYLYNSTSQRCERVAPATWTAVRFG